MSRSSSRGGSTRPSTSCTRRGPRQSWSRRWWSGDRGEVTIAEIDLRVGGTWRYVMMASDDLEVGFHGEYREIVPNERIVSTEVFEGIPGVPGGEALNSLTFTEVDGRTTLEILVEHTDKETRDMVINTGMEAGMQESMDHLEQVAVSLG